MSLNFRNINYNFQPLPPLSVLIDPSCIVMFKEYLIGLKFYISFAQQIIKLQIFFVNSAILFPEFNPNTSII